MDWIIFYNKDFFRPSLTLSLVSKRSLFPWPPPSTWSVKSVDLKVLVVVAMNQSSTAFAVTMECCNLENIFLPCRSMPTLFRWRKMAPPFLIWQYCAICLISRPGPCAYENEIQSYLFRRPKFLLRMTNWNVLCVQIFGYPNLQSNTCWTTLTIYDAFIRDFWTLFISDSQFICSVRSR